MRGRDGCRTQLAGRIWVGSVQEVAGAGVAVSGMSGAHFWVIQQRAAALKLPAGSAPAA